MMHNYIFKNFVYFQVSNAFLKVLSDENQGGSKVVSIASSFFTV